MLLCPDFAFQRNSVGLLFLLYRTKFADLEKLI
jgi:hypothetical protein